jgi:hypothetical protein
MHVEAVRGGLLYAREDLGDSLCVIISGHQFIADGTVVQPVF